LQTFYELAAPQCSAEEFDGEIVAINLDSGIYFSMKAPASWIFSDLCRGHSVETMINVLSTKGNLDLTLDAFIHELVTAGLLRIKEGGAEPNDEPILASVPVESLTQPVLESFGDMQSLLLLDPVHDVDEKLGWPASTASDTLRN
jgi:hypothetical protein